jgi:hypothetical protein
MIKDGSPRRVTRCSRFHPRQTARSMTESRPCWALSPPGERADAKPTNGLARAHRRTAGGPLRVSVGAGSKDRSLRARRNRVRAGELRRAHATGLIRIARPCHCRLAPRRHFAYRSARSRLVRRRRAVGSEQADRRHQAHQLGLPARAGLGKYPAQVRFDRVGRHTKAACRFGDAQAR